MILYSNLTIFDLIYGVLLEIGETTIENRHLKPPQSVNPTKKHGGPSKCTFSDPLLRPSKSRRRSKKKCCQIPDGSEVRRKVRGCPIGCVEGGSPSRSVCARWLVARSVAGTARWPHQAMVMRPRLPNLLQRFPGFSFFSPE